MPFLDDHFLLASDPARDLYHRVAARQPIVDYHCHLSPQDIAEDRRFPNLHEAWLAGDHYKWRAMRADGVAEDLITGSAPPRRKSSGPGPGRCPGRSGTRSSTGPTWSSGGTSASRRCSRNRRPT